MTSATPEVLDELVRASSLLSREINFRSVVSALVEQSLDISHSDLAVLYLYPSDKQKGGSKELKSTFQRGRYDVPKSLGSHGRDRYILGGLPRSGGASFA